MSIIIPRTMPIKWYNALTLAGILMFLELLHSRMLIYKIDQIQSSHFSTQEPEDPRSGTGSDNYLKQASDGRFLAELKRSALQRLQNNPYADLDLNSSTVLHDIKPDYRPNVKLFRNVWPDLNVVGFPKAGTSKLYSILQHHKQCLALAGHKEFCMIGLRRHLWRRQQVLWWEKPETIATVSQEVKKRQLHLFNWFQRLHRLRTAMPSSKKLSVNGCMSQPELYLQLEYAPPAGNKKFFVLFRDPADWLWSSWNFWMDYDLDAKSENSGWTARGKHYRSPELFHELMLSGDRTKSGNLLLSFRRETVELPARLIKHAGRDNILFLKTEEMKPEVIEQEGGFLDQLSSFTGLSRTGFAKRKLHSIENCNAKKKSDCGNSTSSAYAVAGGRDMLPETRRLIYLYFAAECQIWADLYGIKYEPCLAALPRQQEQ